MTELTVVSFPPRSVPGRAIAAGAFAAAALIAVYLGLISLAQGPSHALDQLRADAAFVGLTAAGLGTQIALFVELRRIDRHHRAGAAVTAASTGTSGVAMLACCAHHVVDLLPLVGLSAAAVFLDAYRTPLVLLGLAVNALGIAVIGRQLRRARRACALVGAARP